MKFTGQPKDATPRAQLCEAIKRMILTQGYQVGDKLPTYRQLAEQFGVALLTVQRVMRDLTKEGLVYRLHAKGAFLKRLPTPEGGIAQVGLVYPASMTHLMEASYLREFITGVVHHCDALQADLQVFSIRKAMRRIPVHEITARVDGVILVGVLNEEYIVQFAKEGIPLVLADGQVDQAPVHCLTIDNAYGVHVAMDYLYSLGHRHIGYVDTRIPDFVATLDPNERVDSPDSKERREAYLSAMQRLGLASGKRMYHLVRPRLQRHVEETARTILVDPHRPTAVLAYDSYHASVLYRELCQLGLRIPQDLSLAASMGAKGDGLVGNQVLTFSQADFRGMGWRSVEALLQQASGTMPAQHQIERIGSVLVAGTTVAAPMSDGQPQ